MNNINTPNGVCCVASPIFDSGYQRGFTYLFFSVIFLFFWTSKVNGSNCLMVEDPMAVCKDAILFLDDNGSATLSPFSVDGGSTASAGIASYEVSPNTFDCSNVGDNLVTLTITDNNGATSSCTATVNVQDITAPNTQCVGGFTVQLDANGTASVSSTDLDNGSTDACGIDFFTVTPEIFNCSNVGDNLVTLTAFDVNGSSFGCQTTVTVEENIAPTAICQDISRVLNPSGNLSIFVFEIDNGSFDNCGNPSKILDNTTFDCSNVGDNTVTLTVTDANNNTSTCTATVTVIDFDPPVPVCQNITINLDDNGMASITPDDIDGGTTDACGIAMETVSPNTFGCSSVGDNLVSYTATDVNGNSFSCQATVTVIEDTPPTVTCQDINRVLDGNGNLNISVFEIDNGSSDNCNISSKILSKSTFGCGDLGDNTVTLTIMDVNGNSNSCTSNVNIADIDAPVMVCQDITRTLDANGQVSITAQEVDGGTSDACGISTLTVTPNTFSCANVGDNIVTLTATDVNGNSNSCQATVTIDGDGNGDVDAQCQDITIELDVNGFVAIVPEDVNASPSGLCSAASLTVAPNNFACADVGPNTVTLTATDGNGMTSSCTAVVTVEDNTAPAISCQDINIDLGGNGTSTIVAGNVDGGTVEACGLASLEVSQQDFDCSHIGANTVTLTATDPSGNASSCQATVTVSDNEAPSAVCVDISVDLGGNGSVSITPSDIDGGSMDACGLQPLSISQEAFDCNDAGDNLVTLTVTDVNGNSNSCQATVTVTGGGNGGNLSITCKDAMVVLDGNGDGSIIPDDVLDAVTTSCGITLSSLSVSQDQFDCTDLGSNTIILTATFSDGSTESCQAVVIVKDEATPNALCQNTTITLDDSGNATISAQDIDNGSSDNCEIDFMTLSQTSFGCADLGDNTVTLTVTDVNGNVGSCQATVTVNGGNGGGTLSLSCKDAMVSLDGNGNASIVPDDVLGGVTTSCGLSLSNLSVSQDQFDCADIGSNTIILTATFSDGSTESCQAVVMVSDEAAPNALCQDINVTLDNNGNATISTQDIDNGSSDNCEIDFMTLNQTSFGCDDLGDNTVTLTVADVNGNSSTCSATVTVESTGTSGTLTVECKNINKALGSFGVAGIAPQDVLQEVSASCGASVASMSVTPNFFSCTNLGNNTVVLTVEDTNGGSSSCLATVTVVDESDPMALCQNISVTLDNNGNVIVDPQDVDSGSSDNCNIQTLSLSQSNFDCGDTGPNPVTLTVVDQSGNSSSCTAVVTVLGGGDANFLCKDNMITLDPSGKASINPNDVFAGASGSCGVNVTGLSVSPNSFDCNDLGANTVTLTINTSNGGTGSCQAIVTVKDELSPVVNCKDIAVALDDDGKAVVETQDIHLGSVDNCGVTAISVTPNTFDCEDIGEKTVFVMAEDAAGNKGFCSAKVKIVDQASPEALCKEITVNLGEDGETFITGTAVDGGSTDNCGIVSWLVSPNKFDCSDIPDGEINITLAQTSFEEPEAILEIYFDTGNPSLDHDLINNFNEPIVQFDGEDEELGFMTTYFNTRNSVGLTDGDQTGVTRVMSNLGDFPDGNQGFTMSDTDGALELMLEEVDVSGFEEVILSINYFLMPTGYELNDLLRIYIVFEDDTEMDLINTEGEDIDNLDIEGQWKTLSAVIENHETATLKVRFDCNSSREILYVDNIVFSAKIPEPDPEVTLSVKDEAGNTGTCSTTIKIVDNRPPDVACKNFAVMLGAGGTVTIEPSDIDAGTTDNCELVSLEVEPATFNQSNLGSNTVKLIAKDSYDNESSCEATVIIGQSSNPVAICQDITVQLGDNGQVEITPADIDNGSAAPAGIDFLSLDQTIFDCSHVGDNLVTLTLTDLLGNTASCVAVVTVEPSGVGDVLDLISEDIGLAGSPGFTNYNPCDGALVIGSSGFDGNLAIDSKRFAYQEICGDVEVIAHVKSIETNTETVGWAGITIRDSSEPGAKKISVTTQLTNYLAGRVRFQTGANQLERAFATQSVSWLRLVRTQSLFRAYYSFDGVNWLPVFSTFVSIGSCMQVGFFSESYSQDVESVATFDHISIQKDNNAPLAALEVDMPKGKELLEEDLSVEVFPNPAVHELNVNWKTLTEEATRLQILDINGKLIYQQLVDKDINTVQIDLKPFNLAEGMYYLKLLSDQEVKTTSFVKLKF